MKNIKLWFYILNFTFYTFSFSGCATAPYVAPPGTAGLPGIYHRVEKGQTLWRISRMYDVELDTLAAVNRIADTANIETGQLIFIPSRRQKEVRPQEVSGEDFIWPARARVVATFGQTYQDMVNKGLVLDNRDDTGIFAARAGRVVFYSPHFKGFGKAIIIDHQDGFSTVYSGFSESLVKPGDNVQQGTLIAKGGHLLFQIRKGAVAQNPYFYLP
jgi:murein DD-endopeptidase MepM/ murein hydrolase activator NlpD